MRVVIEDPRGTDHEYENVVSVTTRQDGMIDMVRKTSDTVDIPEDADGVHGSMFEQEIGWDWKIRDIYSAEHDDI